MQVSEHYGASVVAVQRVPRSEVGSYGVIRAHAVRGGKWDGRLFRIEDMVEKPSPKNAPSNLAIIGRYILTPGIFRAIEETRPGAGGEIQLTDALRGLLQSEPVYGYIFEGKRFDAGNKLGFLQATVEMALKRPDLSRQFRRYLRSLKP
jgi:UTP--glucose-1-phosphate uridylyltransferase